MIQLTRDSSGLYLSTDPADARIAFLFQDPARTDPAFQLSAQSWTDPGSLGFIAFFEPSATRNWATFAASIRAAFAQNPGAQIGWFPEPVGNTATLVLITQQGTPSPTLQSSFSLAFRQSVTFQVEPNQFGAPTTVLFDDPTNSFIIAAPQFFQLAVTSPSTGTATYQSNAATMSLVMTGALAGTASIAFPPGGPTQIDEAALAQFEAGLMYFTPAAGGAIAALRYPMFRGAGGAPTPFNLMVSLDVLGPLDPDRTYFQFLDPLLGSYFVTATGKPFALRTVNGGNIANASRLVFAGRPVSFVDQDKHYYLTPAGQFSLAMDAGGAGAHADAASTGAQLLCGVTGTEFLQVGVGASPDRLEFVPGQAAWRIEPSPTSTDPVYLDRTATTSWARVIATNGAYVSQPERSPLYSQSGAAVAEAPSGLKVHVLDFNAIDAWRSSETPGAAPLTPLVPYAGLNFSTDPTLNLAQFLAMESAGLNPTRANAFVTAPVQARHLRVLADTPPSLAMTPQGMVAGLKGDPPAWDSLQIAISPATPPVLEFDAMGPSIQRAVQKNQIFTVVSAPPDTTADPLRPTPAPPLFDFTNRYLEIGGWTFDLSPSGVPSPVPPPNGTPPIFMMKFYPGKAIADLVADPSLWSQPDTFNVAPFTADMAQTYLTRLIADAQSSVYPNGPNNPPDQDSLYYGFYQTVTDPDFSGILAVNCNMQLDQLPPAVRAVLGGMKDPGIAGFRVHHVGVSINDTDPDSDTPVLARSSMFALVDYEGTLTKTPASPYDFEVEYLRALFSNSELRTFDCKVNLTIDQLFATNVDLRGADRNVIVITGSYQANDASDGDGTSGEGVYAFVSEGEFTFDFTDGPPPNPPLNNKFLKTVTITKVQFSFDKETVSTPTTSHVATHFSIWGSAEFNKLEILDVFSFESLEFSNLAITAGFDLTIDPPAQPSTGPLAMQFSPGDLRLDVATSEARPGETTLLNLLPFKLQSFLYSATADQTIESLGYYSFGSIPGLKENGIALADTFNYAMLFDLDLGSMGGLVGSAPVFKFSILMGWLSGPGGGLAFGVQLPRVDGKLEIKIEGVLTISIEQFNLEYATTSSPQMLVLGMKDCYIEVLGKRLPPEGTISLGLFAPTDGADQIGWIGAFNKGEDGGGGDNGGNGEDRKRLAAPAAGGGGIFELDYLGIGQRVGPDPEDPPENFDAFLKYMQEDFWDALKNREYDKIYHPDGKWIFLAHFTLLEKVEIGFVFYDVTPFYSLLLRLTAGAGSGAGFQIEITYTKVTDTIGLFSTTIGLPDSLRTFQAGAASVTLPNLTVAIYTNGNWKVDLGFPDGDDWSGCFRVEAMVGPVPVTGSGGFYLASLSSATDPDVFVGTYPTILAFGLAARLGVGKDFTAGPLKAGVSITFFGIIQGAVGYLTEGGVKNIASKPDALSLQGQFGLIGEIYGSIDFVIIKASVNVRLEASVGIILKLEPPSANAGDGSILLYITASVSVSVSVEIDFFLFSITISFSYDATFRFEWQLVGSGSTQAVVYAEMHQLRAARVQAAPQPLPLCPGLVAAVPLAYLPEMTVIFPDAATAGTPWLVTSLGVPYDDAPAQSPTYDQFKPFEAVTTQLATFALVNALGLAGYDAVVTLDSTADTLGLKDIDSLPDRLIGWLDYPTLLTQLALFKATVAVPATPPPPPAPQTLFMTAFPMPPFMQLSTKGRLDANGKPADLGYQFLSQNLVPPSYLKIVDDYFNQLFVNQTSESSHAVELLGRAIDPTLAPLVQEVFLDYFKGLIRGAVHELLVTMQNANLTTSPLDALFRSAVGAQRIKALAGQMSSSMRGGIRLPYVAGLTVPGGSPQTTTNPLFALLWQTFPVGGFANKTSYTVTLSNPDKTQDWLTANAPFTLTNDVHGVAPYQGLHEADVTKPGAPTPIPKTQTGPQAFAFQNAIVWTPPAPQPALSLRPFPPNLTQLQSAQGGTPIAVLVKSRPTGAAYLPDGTPVPAAGITFATTVNLTVKQIPGAQGVFLKDVFALGGASQTDELLLGTLIAALKNGQTPIAAIQLLYPPSAGQPGLTSATVDPTAVFVLRTNTTTVSQPPVALLMAAQAQEGVSVGADLTLTTDHGLGFVQIVQQATVTNAPGYYLRYIDSNGNSLDPALFAKGPATLTLVITYAPGSGTNQQGSPLAIQPYCNSIALAAAQSGLLYYAETTDEALATRYVSLAAGTAGVTLSRPDSAMHLKPTRALAAAAKVDTAAPNTRAHLLDTLKAAGVTDQDRLRRLLVEAGSAPVALNKRYSVIAYQVEASVGFGASYLSAPIPPQKPSSTDPTGSWRIIAPLYNVALGNAGNPTPNRYADINQPFALSAFVTDVFGNQLPTPLPYDGTNLYFDPLTPLDQWQGIVSSYDFANPQANVLRLHLTPSAAAFDGMSSDRKAAALVLYQTIQNQIAQSPGGPPTSGATFYVETNLALQADGVSFVPLPLSSGDATRVAGLVSGIVNWLSGASPTFPGAVDISVTVAGPGALPPVFDIAVLFGIERDPALVSPDVKDIFPSAQTVTTAIAADTGSGSNLNGFASDFATAFPALTLAVAMDGASAPQQQSKTSAARKRGKALGLAADSSSAGRSGQSLWAVSAALLDVSIGTAPGSGPRYLSPKPLDNALSSATVPLPTLAPPLPALPKQQLFVDVDLDQLNRVFFTAVDAILSPALAAKAFELPDRTAYRTLANGRETLAQKYARYEVDWLFDPKSPFSGTPAQAKIARDVFEQQMRAALMTAYSVDTIVQYDVTWTRPVSAAADGYLELFGRLEAALTGTYTMSGLTVTATTAIPHGLSNTDRLFMTFAPGAGSTAPANGLYAVTVTTDTSFTVTTTSGSGPGAFNATRQNTGLSTAHVAVNSQGPSPLTFLYGNPDVASRSIVSLDLRFDVTNLQYFLAPDSGSPDEARPSIWLHLVAPVQPHVGPADTPTDIPVVFRQYPTPPALISQSWAPMTPAISSGNPIADAADWSYSVSYQAMLAAQDQINSAITYNSDLRSRGTRAAKLGAGADGPYDLFTTLARFAAVNGVIQTILPNAADPDWAAAVNALAASVTEITQNTTWNPPTGLAAPQELVNVTDQYVVFDKVQSDTTTRIITLQWPADQGQSTFKNVTLAIQALDPANRLAPYPDQGPVPPPPPGVFQVRNAPVTGLGVAHRVTVNGLNVLAAENAIAAVQIERNLILLRAPDGTLWPVVREFIYTTAQVRPAQPITPYIDNVPGTPPAYIDVATLPNQGTGAACPPSKASLCQRVYTIMSDLLADPIQNPSLLAAHQAAKVETGTVRRLKVACAFQFPVPGVAGGSDASITPLVPVVLARSFDIDGHLPAQLGDFATIFSGAIAAWASANGIVFGPGATPAGAAFIFDLTLYAALSGVNTPVLGFSNLQLKLTDIDPAPGTRKKGGRGPN